MSAAFAIGAVEVLLTIICFGSTFVPIKKFNGGDGIFVQWSMCAGIFVVGFIVNAITGFGTFYPVACIGGVCWAIGNVVQVPTMRRLGMAVSILVWNAVNCIIGWAASTFGWFGLAAKPAGTPWLNFIGVFFILCGAILFAFVKRTEEEETIIDPKNSNISISKKPFGLEIDYKTVSSNASEVSLEDGSVVAPSTAPIVFTAKPQSRLGVHKDRIIGLAMAIIAGIFFGFNVIPVMYIQDNNETWPEAPDNGLDYIFSHFCGLFFASSIIFVIYVIFKKNKPEINTEIALPSFIAGLLWATAQSLFFAATEILTSAVTYPIVTMVPGCIASLWSVFYFREIKGKRDLLILCGAIGVTIIGTILVGISK